MRAHLSIESNGIPNTFILMMSRTTGIMGKTMATRKTGSVNAALIVSSEYHLDASESALPSAEGWSLRRSVGQEGNRAAQES